MKVPFIERRATYKESFSSRKYRFVFFWNILTGIAIIAQVGLAVAKINVDLPLEMLIGFSGGLTAGYLGINVLEKKVTGTTAPAPTTEVKK